MNTKHTSAPWIVKQFGRTRLAIWNNQGFRIANMVSGGKSPEEAEANAHMAAAAPYMFEACIEALHALTLSDDCQNDIEEVKTKIRAAISRAVPNEVSVSRSADATGEEVSK